jgi:hypothetical protein
MLRPRASSVTPPLLIFARLRDEHGYAGGYDQVRRYVSQRRKRERETHLLLDHPPGARLECDFGQIHVDFPEGRRLVQRAAVERRRRGLLVTTLAGGDGTAGRENGTSPNAIRIVHNSFM